MNLFLASEAKNPHSLPKLTEVVGGWKGKSIAYIPTAANGEGWGSWREGGSWNLIKTLDADVTLVQLEDYRTAEVAQTLMNKDVIWMAGGSPGYLTYWLRRTELDKNLPSLLNDKNWYVGSSAGSMVTGQSSDTMNWYVGESEPGAHYLPPLKLVNFDIYPHYRDEHYDHIRQHYQGPKMYLLKDGEAVVVSGQTTSVWGEERTLTATSG